MFNKIAKIIRATYFPNENHGTTENPNYWEATEAMEGFNNGVIGWQKMTKILSKCCECSENDISTLLQEVNK